MVHVRDYLADQEVLRSERAPLHPVVSVALPTWRRFATGTLARAVDSVLGQSFRDLELIVVDDGSTDGTWDYLRERQARDPRLVLVRHEQNSGLPAIRVNEAIELSRGRYLAFQFDDDEWVDGALDMLVARAEGLSELAVVYGEALLIFPDGHQDRYPSVDVKLTTLFWRNHIANNSVLVPRSVLERFGLFDCHIAMRRLCDWDLWLRLVRHVPFVAAGGLVSRVYVAQDPSALGLIAPYDIPLVRFLMALPRNELLSLARWRDYEVDALCVAGVDVPRGLRHRLIAEQIRPYYEQPGLSNSIRAKQSVLRAEPPPGPRTLICVLDGCYPSTDLCFGHYDDLTRARRTYVRFEQLTQMSPTWTTETDLLLFVRTVLAPAPELARCAAAVGIPTAYYLDDDFLSLHEYGPPFDNLAPGQPFRANLVAALQQVDAVWATSPVIAESVRPHNARIVPHNGAVPEAWLPTRLRPRGAGGRIRIAHTGSGYRVKEFEHIWEGLRQVAREFSDLVEFEFWGVDVSELPALEAPTSLIPYIQGYSAFTTRMREAGLDILITPLLDRPRPRLAKSPNKYYHTAAAGAFGIFSDVPPYAGLPHGLTCLKAANTPEAWYEALCEALRMPEERFDAMRRSLIEHVRLEFTETAQIHLHEAACRATELHRHTTGHRHPDGRPRVLLLGSSDRRPSPELQDVLRRYAIEPVVATQIDEREGSPAARELEQWLTRERPALAVVSDQRSTSARVCRESGVPIVAGVPEVVLSLDSFARGLRRILRDTALENARRPVVAIGTGVEGPSGTSLADHPEAPEIRRLDSVGTVDLSKADILVAPAGEKALLARAAAEGVLLVSVSAAGSLPEDGVSGIVCPDSGAEAVAQGIRRALDLTAAERLRLRTAAYRAARAQAHPDAVANELLSRFNGALEEAAAAPTRPDPPPPPPAAGPVISPVARPSAKAVLKRALDRVGLFRPISRLTWLARRKRVLVVYEDLFASERFHREVLGELEAATRRTWIFRPAREIDPKFLYSFRTVILVRGTSVESLQVLEAARASGCATLYDADDNLLLLAQFIPDPENEWRRKYDPARPSIEAMLASVDAVKVYSEAAASIFRRLNPNVVVIPAYQRITRRAPPAGRSGAPVTVGFLGTPHKDEEFATLVPAIARLLDEGRPLRFELFGFGPKALAARPEITVHPWERDYRQYREKLDGLGWDIGVAPLRDTEFNQCKSNAKYREYAASGIAGIYSDARIYRDSIAHRKTGLIVPHADTQAWYDAIVELCTDEGLRTTIASQAFEDVRTNYRPEDYVSRVADLVESLRPRRG